MTIHAIAASQPSVMRACARVRCSHCALAASRSPAIAQEAPDALVKRVSQEVLQIIKTDPRCRPATRRASAR